jgi:ABC-type nitrate/sulfonate/bicarbonate transport system substrate-binding protein
VAVPAHGNTQDLTLRLLLQKAGLRGDDQGGDVGIVPVKNSALGDAIDGGAVDAALAPEPYAAKLEAKGKVVPVAPPGKGGISALRWNANGSMLAFGTDKGFCGTVDLAKR